MSSVGRLFYQHGSNLAEKQAAAERGSGHCHAQRFVCVSLPQQRLPNRNGLHDVLVRVLLAKDLPSSLLELRRKAGRLALG